jgi:hypothetical protein
MLLNKRKNAIRGLNTTHENLDDLSATIPEATRHRWLQQEAAALKTAEKFKIYDVDIAKGWFSLPLLILCNK